MPDILLHAACSQQAEKRGKRNGFRLIRAIELILVLELIDGGHRALICGATPSGGCLELEEAVEPTYGGRKKLERVLLLSSI